MPGGLRIDVTARDPVVVRHRVVGTALPAMRIAVLSDVHCSGWWATRRMLADTVRQVNGLAPDLAVFAGDAQADRLMPHRRIHPIAIARELSRIEARLGLWSVLGNHDWKDDPVAIETDFETSTSLMAFERIGLEVLHNRGVEFDGFWLVGVESRRARTPFDRPGLDDPDRAFADVPEGAPTILIAHEPDIFAEDTRALLQISGHTHGGQIAPFGWTPIIPSDYGNRYAWGHYREDGRHLVVSGGWGFVGLPLRVGRPPEITVIDIEREEP